MPDGLRINVDMTHGQYCAGSTTTAIVASEFLRLTENETVAFDSKLRWHWTYPVYQRFSQFIEQPVSSWLFSRDLVRYFTDFF